MQVKYAEDKHSNGALNHSLGRLSGRGSLTGPEEQLDLKGHRK